jgi:predicted nuclease of restriction endonuclease-like (RecB) superfamily
VTAQRNPKPASAGTRPRGYAAWLAELEVEVRVRQQHAALAVNRELLLVYWQLGRNLLDRQANEGWGKGVVDRLAYDLRVAFPNMKKTFSRINLMHMRAFAKAWPDPEFIQQPVGQLPWGHILVLLTKLKSNAARLAHAEHALRHGWSREVLARHIEKRTLERQGQYVTRTLSPE